MKYFNLSTLWNILQINFYLTRLHNEDCYAIRIHFTSRKLNKKKKKKQDTNNKKLNIYTSNYIIESERNFKNGLKSMIKPSIYLSKTDLFDWLIVLIIKLNNKNITGTSFMS